MQMEKLLIENLEVKRVVFDGHIEWAQTPCDSPSSVDSVPSKRASIALSKTVTGKSLGFGKQQRISLQHIDYDALAGQSQKGAGAEAAARKKAAAEAAFPWELTGPNGQPLPFAEDRNVSTPLLARKPRRIRVSRIHKDTPSVPPLLRPSTAGNHSQSTPDLSKQKPRSPALKTKSKARKKQTHRSSPTLRTPLQTSFARSPEKATSPQEHLQPESSPITHKQKANTNKLDPLRSFDSSGGLSSSRSQVPWPSQVENTPDPNLVDVLSKLSRAPSAAPEMAMGIAPSLAQSRAQTRISTLRTSQSSVGAHRDGFKITNSLRPHTTMGIGRLQTASAPLMSQTVSPTTRVPVMNRTSTKLAPGFRSVSSLTAGGHGPRLPRSIENKLASDRGNWPLLTQARVDARLAREQKELEDRIRYEEKVAALEEKKRLSAQLKEEERRKLVRMETEKMLHGAPLQEDEELLAYQQADKRHRKARRMWKKAVLTAQKEKYQRVKPPELKTRSKLRGLRVLADEAQAKGVYFAWPLLQKAFVVNVCELPLKDAEAEMLTVKPRKDDPGKAMTVFRFKELLMSTGIPENDVERLIKHNKTLEIPQDGKLTYEMVYEAFWPNKAQREVYDAELVRKRNWEEEQTKLEEQRMIEYEKKLIEKRRWAIDEMRDHLSKLYPPTKHSRMDYRKKRVMVRIMERNARKLIRMQSSQSSVVSRDTLDESDTSYEYYLPGIALMDLHISLKNSVRQQLMDSAKYGLSLFGFSAQESVQLFQNYCATRIAAAFRGWDYRRKAKQQELLRKVTEMAKRNRQREIYRLISSVFNEWFIVINRQVTIRAFCSRKFYLWKKFVEKKKAKETLMSYCLWPIHIWRRYTARKIVARAKAKTLKRVWKTYWVLRHFRGWRRVVRRKLQPVRDAVAHQHDRLCREVTLVLGDWHRWAQGRRRRRQVYLRDGYKLRLQTERRLRLYYFMLWRWWSMCQCQARKRAEKYFRSYFILSGQRRQRSIKLRQGQAAAPEEEGLKGIQENTGDDTSTTSYNSERTTTSYNRSSRRRKKKKKRKGKNDGLDDDIEVEVLGGGVADVPPFPSIEFQEWSGSLSSNLLQICEDISEIYKEKEEVYMKENWLKYRRCAPYFIARLIANVRKQRIWRYVQVKAAERIKRWAFNGFRDAVVESLAQDELKYNRRKYKKSSTIQRLSLQSRKNKSSLYARKLQKISNLMSLGNKEMTQLDRDRLRRDEERDVTNSQVARMMSILEKHRNSVVREIKHDGRFLFARQKEADALQAFMDDITHETNLADGNAMKFAAEFQLYAAQILLDACHKVYGDYLAYVRKIMLRNTLRCLRLPVISRKVRHLSNIRKMRNWIRICRRLICFDKGMHYYRKLRIQWVVFNRMLHLVEEKYKYTTPGLFRGCKRRAENMLLLGQHLLGTGLEEKSYTYNELQKVSFTTRACFYSWLNYNEENFMWAKLSAALREQHRLRFLQRAFYSFKMRLRPISTWEIRKSNVPFGLKRCAADAMTIRSRMLGKHRLDPATKIRNMNRVEVWKLRIQAMKGPSFKKFIHDFEERVRHRAAVEQRLLVEAFHSRGILKYSDTLMEEHLSGSTNLRNASSFKDIEVPGAYLISEIHVVTRPSQGVVGYWMVAKGGDCAYTLKTHGVLSGKEEVYRLRTPEESLFQIEIIYSSVIEKIRFITSAGRVSEWFGERLSPQPDRSFLPPKPIKGRYITGTFGYETNLRILAIGVTIRQVLKSDLFSYYWAEQFRGDNVPEMDTINENEESAAQRSEGDPITLRAKNKSRMDRSVVSGQTIDLAQVASSTHEMEFAAVLRMRLSDVYSAMYRAIEFARRVWGNPGINLRWDLNDVCKLGVIKGLTRWFFESICWRLVPYVEKTEEIESEIEIGREKVLQGKHMQSSAAMYKRRAEFMEQQPVSWRRRGLLSPEDRRKEKEFKEHIAALLQKAETSYQDGQIQIDGGRYSIENALSRLPQLDQTPENLAYYLEKLTIAKTQLQLETSLGQGAFRDGLKTIGGEVQGSLNDQIFDTVTGALRKKMFDEARDRTNTTSVEEVEKMV